MKEDMIEDMLQSAYAKESVPDEVNERLKRELAKRKEKPPVSLWWMPATAYTVISAALGLILCLVYLVVNIQGSRWLMPNLLQLISEYWLKLNLIFIVLGTAVSWIVTFVGVWKGNLIQGARIF